MGDGFDAGAGWPGGRDAELRPFRPADARAARQRRTPAPRGGADSPTDDLTVELLDHLTVLSEIVTANAAASRQQVQALAAKLTVLSRTLDALTADVQELRAAIERSTAPPGGIAPRDVDAVATAVAAKLQAAFRVVPGR